MGKWAASGAELEWRCVLSECSTLLGGIAESSHYSLRHALLGIQRRSRYLRLTEFGGLFCDR